MVLPVATRTVTILRAAGLDTVDGYDTPPAYQVVARDVRAVITATGGQERTVRAQAEQTDAKLTMDPTPAGLTHLDLILDDHGKTWEVVWVQDVLGVGLDHISAGLVAYDGQGI